MSRQAAEAAARLADCGLRKTEPRTAIITTLMQAEEPLSQDHIAKKLGRGAPDKTTIYRTLEQLCLKGVVHRAYVQRRQWYFELADKCSRKACHPHFTCRKCGRINCLTESSAGRVKNLPTGFTVRSMQVRLEGFCPKCSAKTTSRQNRS